MEKKQIGMDDWIVRATQQIKFAPDRSSVAAELREHIEDKIFDIRRIYSDMPEDEAMQRALNQMGDAEEVGRELAKIHTPWLGYLWRASQVLLCAACLFIAFQIWMGIDLWPGFGPTSFYSTGEGVEHYMEKRYPEYYDAKPTELVLPQSVTAGEYHIAVTRAELWGTTEEQPDWKYEREIYLTFEVEYDRFWETPAQFIDRLYAVDDLGNKVLSWREFNEWEGEPAPIHYTKFGGMTYKTPRLCRYEIIIPVPAWEAKYLDVRYDWIGTEISFKFDLTGGAV